MSAAAAKRTVLAAASLAAVLSVSILVSAGGAASDRDHESPTPPKNLRVISATPSRVQIAWDPSVDDVEVAGYYIFGDKGKATLDKPEQLLKPEYAVTELGCGESTVITVVAFDASQNRSEKATTTVATAACFDTQPPTPPSGFKQVATSGDSVVLAWDASSDNVGVVGYGVYRNLQREATAAEPTTTLSGLSCGSTYDYAVDASDAAGNRSLRASVFVQTASCPSPPSSGDTTPPSAPSGLAASNTTQTGLTLNWNAATDNVGVTGYDVYRNGSKITSVSATNAGQSGLSCGTSYTFAVVARDAAGNSSPSAQRTAATGACSASSGDTTPPSAPSGLAASNTTQTGLTLNWNAATDNVGVTGYDVYRNGSKITSVSATNAGQSGLSCGTSYTFAVVARDAAGNSSPSAQRTAATGACSASSGDTTPPSAPSGLAASNTTQTGLTLNWNAATDNVGVTGYDVYRNGSKITSVSATNAGQSGLSCGTSYTFAVVARDAAGNSSPSAQRTAATGACSAPSVDTTPPSQPTNLGIVGATGSSIALAWSASNDNVGVGGYRVYVNGSFASSTTQRGITVAALNCGTAYTFEVEAFDAAGNSSTRAAVTGSTPACPDTQPPSAPANVVATTRTATSIALTWSTSSDNVGVTGYGLYRGGSAAGTASTTTGIFSGLSCGTNYTLAVDAYDAAGNRSSQTVVMVATTACADTSAPSTPSGLAASNVTQTGAALSWNASADNVGVTGYDVYRNAAKVATVTSTSSSQTGLTCGTSYTFGVVARDAAGNSSSQASLQVSTSACSTLPAQGGNPIPTNGVISQGGTYSGEYTGTVKIATTAAVTIANARITNLTGGALVDANSAGAAQVTLDHVVLVGGDSYQTSGRAFMAYGYKSVTIRNCTIENTRGIEINEGAPGSTVLITKNRHKNVQGNNMDPVGNFVQFRDVQNAAIEVSWNEIINEYNKSNPTDLISVYKTSHTRIHDNYFQHQSIPGNAVGSYQNGITVEGSSPNPDDNEIWNNQLVDGHSIGLFGFSGSNNYVHDNRVVQDGYLPDGVTRISDGYRPFWLAAGGSNNHMHNNIAGYVNSSGDYMYGNFPGAPEGDLGERANNSYLPQPITQATEQNEWNLWQGKLAANGIQIGA